MGSCSSKSSSCWTNESEDDGSNLGDQLMWFGKYEGVKFDELDNGYVNWLVEQYNKNPEMAGQNVSNTAYSANYD